MKQFLFLPTLLLLSLCGISQSIGTRDNFAKAFISIYEQRRNGFDTLVSPDWPEVDRPALLLPGARECYISGNRVYGALYRGVDSLKMLSFYREMKAGLAHAATYYKATVKFQPITPGDPFSELIYFTDSTLFTNEGSSIYFSKSELEEGEDEDEEEEENDDDPDLAKKNAAAKDSFEVLLLIRPGGQVGYFTNVGGGLPDGEVKKFVDQAVFGKDPSWKAYRGAKKMDGEVAVYDSKLKLQGFAAQIRERSSPERVNRSLTLTRTFNMTEQEFLKAGDSLLLKLNAALPRDYFYEVEHDEDGTMVTFAPVPFMKHTTNRRIEVYTSAVVGKANTYKLQVIVR